MARVPLEGECIENGFLKGFLKNFKGKIRAKKAQDEKLPTALRSKMNVSQPLNRGRQFKRLSSWWVFRLSTEFRPKAIDQPSIFCLASIWSSISMSSH